jgi:glycosyltransferase involved in cell wall biosynthesis
MKPLLSVITATYNSEKTLARTFMSVLNQNGSNFEYLVVDGNSSDKTLAIIKEYESLFKEKNIVFKWISESDTGIYNAWNKGLKLASGQWISFLGSDDIYLENALEKYTAIINNNPTADFVHSKVKLVDGEKPIYNITRRWNWNTFKKEMKIAHVGAFHNAKYFEKFGHYDEYYKIVGDYEMLLRAKETLKTIFIPEFTVNMTVGGISNENINKAFKEAAHAKTNTLGTHSLFTNLYAIYAINKHHIISFFRSKFQ